MSKVLVALSGGLDSAVSAALLQSAGHEIIGVHLQFWTEDFRPTGATKTPENKCCSLESLEVARRLCAKLEIPFYVLNFREPFYREVVQNFLAGYGAGQTPNPCVVCNRTIKFGLLLQKMQELGAQAVASGHYAQIQTSSSGERELHRGADPEKDQSYFLWHLGQAKLRHILFPVGHMQKPAVRAIATQLGLPHTSTQKESTGACFFPEENPKGFLQRHLPAAVLQPGAIRTVTGQVIGQHQGLPLYTIGQRRGVDLGGLTEPYFVVGMDRRSNELIVGPDPATLSKKLVASQLSWVAGTPPAQEWTAQIQIRYRMQPVSGIVRLVGDTAEVEFAQAVRAVTPGQSIVFYAEDRVLGGGVIDGTSE